MSGLGAFALGAAPLAGGVLLGGMAGKARPSGPDLRTAIKSELDLLERIPAPAQAARPCGRCLWWRPALSNLRLA